MGVLSSKPNAHLNVSSGGRSPVQVPCFASTACHWRLRQCHHSITVSWREKVFFLCCDAYQRQNQNFHFHRQWKQQWSAPGISKVSLIIHTSIVCSRCFSKFFFFASFPKTRGIAAWSSATIRASTCIIRGVRMAKTKPSDLNTFSRFFHYNGITMTMTTMISNPCNNDWWCQTLASRALLIRSLSLRSAADRGIIRKSWKLASK